MSKKDENALQTTAPGAVVAYNYGDEAGAGFEGTKGTDLSIPFLNVLQSNSPQVEDQKPEGAAAGMLFNTVTGELVPVGESVNFLPVLKQDAYVEWVPREKGGGFVGVYSADAPEVKKAQAAQTDKFGKLFTEAGNDLIETHYMYGLLLDESGQSTQGFAVLAFTSTKIKPFRDWTTAMYMVKGRPPIYAFRAKISTIKQKNDKGSYYNFSIAPLGKTWVESLINPQSEADLLKEARDFRELVESGVARAAYETQEHGTSAPPPDGEKPPF